MFSLKKWFRPDPVVFSPEPVVDPIEPDNPEFLFFVPASWEEIEANTIRPDRLAHASTDTTWHPTSEDLVEGREFEKQYEPRPYERVLPKGALYIPRKLTKNEYELHRLGIQLRRLGLDAKVPKAVLTKLKDYEKGPRRVTLDANGKKKEVKGTALS